MYLLTKKVKYLPILKKKPDLKWVVVVVQNAVVVEKEGPLYPLHFWDYFWLYDNSGSKFEVVIQFLRNYTIDLPTPVDCYKKFNFGSSHGQNFYTKKSIARTICKCMT